MADIPEHLSLNPQAFPSYKFLFRLSNDTMEIQDPYLDSSLPHRYQLYKLLLHQAKNHCTSEYHFLSHSPVQSHQFPVSAAAAYDCRLLKHQGAFQKLH